MGVPVAWRRWISPRPSKTLQSAVDTAVRFLAGRPRSEYEVRRRLRSSGADETLIEAVLALLRRHQLLDDAAFARYWVEQRQTFRPRGARLLRAELNARGVDAALSQEVAEETRPTAEEDAYRAAAKRARLLGDLGETAFTVRLGSFLARRGFDWETITPVVKRVWGELSRS